MLLCADAKSGDKMMKYIYFEKNKILLSVSTLLTFLYPFSCFSLMIFLFPLHSSMCVDFPRVMMIFIGLGFLRQIVAICISRFYLSTYWLWLIGFCVFARVLRYIDLYYGRYWTGLIDFLFRW